jgi:hypothetical protein
MKKKYIIFSIVTLVLLVTLVTCFNYFKNTKNYVEDNTSKPTKITKGISMNLEQTAGAGDYKTVTQSSWPTEGYKFNTELSRCENGSELSWDDTKKAVIVSGNLSDKCYVYFDIWIPSIADYCTSGTDLATCVKNFGNQGSSVSSIYIHDSSLTNGAGDNSYRYAGANPNNFVCFGTNASPCPTDNLYRIVGVFGENYHGVTGKQLVKLIKYDYANSNLLGTDGDYKGSGTPNASYYEGSLTTINTYYWNYKADTSNYNNTWSTSLLNKTNLNTNFINNIGTIWANKIATTTWKVGGNTNENIRNAVPSIAYQNEVLNPAPGSTSTTGETTYTAKIGLMYASDYGFGAVLEAWTTTLYSYSDSVNEATIRSQNWMHMGYSEWTVSRSSDFSVSAFYAGHGGHVLGTSVDSGYGVRPSFFLESSITYVSGSGSMSDPIRIN